MKLKHPNLLQYMNFSKKNKSTNKGKCKAIIPNYLDSFTNKYPTYLQSSLNEDIFLLKKKLKGYSKIHSHSTNNTNKNIETKKVPTANNISSISPITPINNYIVKKNNNNIYVNKSIKNNLMLTSMNNNNSLIYKSKSKEKIIGNNNIKKPIFKNNKTNNSLHGLNNINYNFNINKKNINNFFNNNNHYENNITKNIKFNNKDNKKYSMTSVSSRKISKEREKIKTHEKINSINSINKINNPQNKINFNGLLNNYNYINNKQYLTKNVNNNNNKNINNINNSNNRIINENNYIKNNNISNNNNNSSNNNININLNGNKKLFMVDFNNLKKGKLLNDFLESYLKSSQTSNNRKVKPNINNSNNYINSNNNNYITSTKNSHKNISSTANTSLVKTNNFFQSSSPNSGNDFFKTAKISPRSSFPKKNQEIIQSHRVNVKNKLQGNIFSFYDNCKNNKENNNVYNNNSNTNLGNYSHSITSHLNKKKNINMSVNMNITYNNKNFNMSNLNKNKNRSMINNEDIIDNNIKFNLDKANKSNSLNKIKNINIIENYNYDYNLINKNDTNTHYNNHNSSNNSFINIRKNPNPIIGGNNIINNCKININNINYNNYNNTNNNQIINAKIIQINESKPPNKIYSSSQQELTQIKKSKNKNFSMNNSPNKNGKYKISNNNSQINIKINSNINAYLNKNNNKSNNSLKSKENKKINYELKEKPKTNNNSLLFSDKINEILELKHNLQKNNSELYAKPKSKKESKDKNKKPEKDKEIINNNKNTISNLSSTTHDSNYYMEKCNTLSKYIREFYRRYNKYPNTNLNFYLYGRLIGQGAFGKVNIGLNILTGRVVAIKSFNKKTLSANGDNMKKILSETDLMKKLNHPNITKILEMFEDDGYILIAMEYINGGNLFSFVKKRRKLSEKTAKFLFRQIILGIKHIHSKKIVHRDIKLENILIDLNNNIKICDFGIGRILKNEKQMLFDKCGTPMYMAPEILLSSKTKGYEGFPVDIWSSGISLYIMLSGTLPFNLKNKESSDMSNESNNNNIELQYSIINKEPKKIEKISDEARDLLKGLLNKNPKKRLTIEQILNHPWLMEGEIKNKKNKKYHLFTKAEMIMLSKTYIDYRNSLIDDLKENFTISNLKMENNKALDKNKKLKNITTKSSLLAPYNTLIQNEESISEDNIISHDEFDDLVNPNIILENDIMIVNNKIKEFNLNYELNNNGECDHGMLINTKTDTISSSITNNPSQISSRNENEDEMDENSDNEENEEEQEKKTEKILEEIERIGYDRKYVMSTVKNNELCHASAIFYLMMNYKDI